MSSEQNPSAANPETGGTAPDAPASEETREFLSIFNRGADFLREVVNENERLRYRITSLEEEKRNLPGGGQGDEALRQELESWKHKYNSLVARIEEVERENKDFLNRYMEVEEENNNLANLYIASYQLHSTLNFKEVLQIILEIVINLIGAETFGVYLLDEKEQRLNVVASEGLEPEDFPSIGLGQGEIGDAVQRSEMALFEDRLQLGKLDLDRPLAVIPLQIKDETIGAIVVYQLLQQKSKFLDVDRELFHLLAGHAATAIFASKLYTESERKLSTMQGFIDLLTK